MNNRQFYQTRIAAYSNKHSTSKSPRENRQRESNFSDKEHQRPSKSDKKQQHSEPKKEWNNAHISSLVASNLDEAKVQSPSPSPRHNISEIRSRIKQRRKSKMKAANSMSPKAKKVVDKTPIIVDKTPTRRKVATERRDDYSQSSRENDQFFDAINDEKHPVSPLLSSPSRRRLHVRKEELQEDRDFADITRKESMLSAALSVD